MSVIETLSANDAGYHVTGNLPPEQYGDQLSSHVKKLLLRKRTIQRCNALTRIVVSEEDVGEGGATGFAGVADPKNGGDLVAGLGEGDVERPAGHDDEDDGAPGGVGDSRDELRLLSWQEEVRPVQALALHGLVGADHQHGHVSARRGLRGGAELEAVPAAPDVGASRLVHGGDVGAEALERRRVLARRTCTMTSPAFIRSVHENIILFLTDQISLSRIGVTFVVADHGEAGIGVGANDGHGLDGLGGERQRAGVLEEDDALARGLAGQLLVRRRAHVLGAEAAEGELPRVAVEEAESHEHDEVVGDGPVDVGLRQLPGLHRRHGVLRQEVAAVQVQTCHNLVKQIRKNVKINKRKVECRRFVSVV